MPRKRIWKRIDIALLGTVSDAAVAKRLGISSAAVCHKRHSLRIPAFRKRFRAWGITELSMLGRYSDAEIAKLTHRPLNEVEEKRKSLNIRLAQPHKPIRRVDRAEQKMPAKNTSRKCGLSRRLGK
jgi:hypothetical protein